MLSYFHTVPVVIQLTVSLFVLTTGIGQLFLGPYSDQVGRRKIVLTAICLFLVGSLVCALANNIWIVILGRIIQAIGACGMMVTAFAIVRDIFEGDNLTKTYSYLNSMIALSPLFAPMIGGYLDVHFGWRAVFYALAIIAACTLVLAIVCVSETHPSHKRTEFTTEVIHSYKDIICNKQFQTFVFCGAAGMTCFFTFFSMSSYIIIDLLKIPEIKFGFYFGVIGIMELIGGLISANLASRIGTYKTVVTGVILMLIAGSSMLIWDQILGLNIYGFITPMIAMAIGGSIVISGGAGGAMEPFKEQAGAASAMFGAIEFITAFIISTLIMLRAVHSAAPLGILITTVSILSLFLCLARKSAISMHPAKNL